MIVFLFPFSYISRVAKNGHPPRESNQVAHELASKGMGSFSTVWQEDPPDFIRVLLVNDVSLFEN